MIASADAGEGQGQGRVRYRKPGIHPLDGALHEELLLILTAHPVSIRVVARDLGVNAYGLMVAVERLRAAGIDVITRNGGPGAGRLIHFAPEAEALARERAEAAWAQIYGD